MLPVRLLTIAFFSLHLLAVGGRVMVCRYTGEVRRTCCCPHLEAEQAGDSEAPQVSTACCCEIRDLTSAQLLANANGTNEPVPTPTVVSIAPPHRLDPLEGPARAVDTRSASPPAKAPLYLLERHLLI